MVRTRCALLLRYIEQSSRLGALLIILTLGSFSFAAQEVPFKLTMEGGFVFIDETSATISGTGISSHGGYTTLFGNVGISPTTACPSPPGYHAIQSNEYEVANGDLIFITVDEDACFETEPGIATVNGTWEITGGTGRFSGATGSGTYLGFADFNTNTGEQNLTGTISVPMGKKDN